MNPARPVARRPLQRASQLTQWHSPPVVGDAGAREGVGGRVEDGWKVAFGGLNYSLHSSYTDLSSKSVVLQNLSLRELSSCAYWRQ